MQIIRIFILATIIAFVPVLALPVGVESQELVAREPSLSGGLKRMMEHLKKVLQRIGKRRSPTASLKTREIYAREDTDDLYIRELDDEIYAREFEDELEARDELSPSELD